MANENSFCKSGSRVRSLRVLVWQNAPQAQEVLADFYDRFKDEALSLDQWFMILCKINKVSYTKTPSIFRII
jgi:ABC-type sulfate transport system substrate-binding protein